MLITTDVRAHRVAPDRRAVRPTRRDFHPNIHAGSKPLIRRSIERGNRAARPYTRVVTVPTVWREAIRFFFFAGKLSKPIGPEKKNSFAIRSVPTSYDPGAAPAAPAVIYRSRRDRLRSIVNRAPR